MHIKLRLKEDIKDKINTDPQVRSRVIEIVSRLLFNGNALLSEQTIEKASLCDEFITSDLDMLVNIVNNPSIHTMFYIHVI